ncbi:hypothetical protein P154DRAFT_575256 [Amniculicola lignicola CBS 123094]|uniref:Cora-domain-containing protein n=1 Tax=Amniculicola lignicola CBS 123094 TaxID=1392246 RepID=A0A6A5WJS1_9PLEO|nr:hypothetical protein P154DRAFT_575256 [Amniculicola lignicola CBS 123094]
MARFDCMLITTGCPANPFDFIAPHCRLLPNQATETYQRYRLEIVQMTDMKFRRDVFGEEEGMADLSSEEEQSFKIWMLAEELTASLEKLQDFTASNGITRTPSVQLLESTLQMLVAKTTRLKDAFKDQLSRRAAMMSLQESRKSIQLADSVRNLTQLAFIFIPLTFGASIFGSNIQEFGSGSVTAWKLCVTLLAVLLGTFGVTWLWSIRNLQIVPASKRR